VAGGGRNPGGGGAGRQNGNQLVQCRPLYELRWPHEAKAGVASWALVSPRMGEVQAGQVLVQSQSRAVQTVQCSEPVQVQAGA